MQPGQSAPIATLSDYNYAPTCYPPASGGVAPSFGYSSLQPQQLLPPLQYPTPQPATNCFPAAGYVHDGVGASCVQVGYIAPSSGNQSANAAAAATAKPVCVVLQHQQAKNYAGYLALAVFVFMCCCPICGCLAICLAGVASSKAATDRSGARRAARVSLALSLSGVAIAAIVVIVVISVLCSNYRVAGQCFRHREITDHFSCSFNHFDGNPLYDNGYCYWN